MIYIFDKEGRVTQISGSSDPAFAAQLEAQGVGFVQVGMDPSDTYIDDPAGARSLRLRPELPGDWSARTCLSSQEITHPDVPACEVMVHGPSGYGTLTHPVAGTLRMAFVLPGEYTVAFEAFPYRRKQTTITVTPRLAQITAGANQ